MRVVILVLLLIVCVTINSLSIDKAPSHSKHKRHHHKRHHRQNHGNFRHVKDTFEGSKVYKIRSKLQYYKRLCKNGGKHAMLLCHHGAHGNVNDCVNKKKQLWCMEVEKLKKKLYHARLSWKCFHTTPPNTKACHTLQNYAINFEAKHYVESVRHNDTKACHHEISHKQKYICEGGKVCNGLLMRTCLESKAEQHLQKAETLCVSVCKNKPTKVQQRLCFSKLSARCGSLSEDDKMKCFYDCKHAKKCAMWRSLAKRFCKYHPHQHLCAATVEQRLCTEATNSHQNLDSKAELHDCLIHKNSTSCTKVKHEVLTALAKEAHRRFSMDRTVKTLNAKAKDYEHMCKSSHFVSYLCEFAGAMKHQCIADTTHQICNHYDMLDNDLDGLKLDIRCQKVESDTACHEFRTWHQRSQVKALKHLKSKKKLMYKKSEKCKMAQELAGKACAEAKHRQQCERHYIENGCDSYTTAQRSFRMTVLHYRCHFKNDHQSCMQYSQFKFTHTLQAESETILNQRKMCRNRQKIAEQHCSMEEHPKLCVQRLTRDICFHTPIDVDALRPRYASYKCHSSTTSVQRAKYCRESQLLKKYFIKINQYALLGETEPLIKFQAKACSNAVAEGGLLCHQTEDWHNCVKLYKKNVCDLFDSTLRNQTLHVLEARCKFLHNTDACHCAEHPEDDECLALINGVKAFYHHHWKPPQSVVKRKTECDETLAHRVATSMCEHINTNNTNNDTKSACYHLHHDQVCVAAQVPVVSELKNENELEPAEPTQSEVDMHIEIPASESESITNIVLKKIPGGQTNYFHHSISSKKPKSNPKNKL